jgi:hypothetical protein
MKCMRTIVFAAGTALAASVAAQTCSGGAGGGMDATGSQCNDASFTAATVGVAQAAGKAVAPSVVRDTRSKSSAAARAPSAKPETAARAAPARQSPAGIDTASLR